MHLCIMNSVYIALGSNRGDRENNLQKAMDYLEEKAGRIAKVSSVYETQPWQMDDHTNFLNRVVLLETDFNASGLMNCILQIEAIMGRIRTNSGVYEPRTIDIDILFFNRDIIHGDSLVIPHPQIAKRRFVLQPLSEIAPFYVHPQLKKTICELLASCADGHSISKLVV